MPARVASHSALRSSGSHPDRRRESALWSRRCSCRSAHRQSAWPPDTRRQPCSGKAAPRGCRAADAAVEGLKQPRRGVAIAEQDGSGELAVAHDHLLVNSARRLANTAPLRRPAGLLVAHTRRSTPMTLSFVDTRSRVQARDCGRSGGRRGPAPAPTAARRARRPGRGAARTRRWQRRRGSIGAAEIVADDDAAFDGQSGSARQGGIGPNAARDDHHLAFQPRAVIESRPLTRGRRAPPWSAPFEMLWTPNLSSAVRSKPARALVELHLHQVASQVHDVDLEPSSSSPRAASSPRRPPPITAARASPARTRSSVAVLERAEGEEAFLHPVP